MRLIVCRLTMIVANKLDVYRVYNDVELTTSSRKDEVEENAKSKQISTSQPSQWITWVTGQQKNLH